MTAVLRATTATKSHLSRRTPPRPTPCHDAASCRRICSRFFRHRRIQCHQQETLRCPCTCKHLWSRSRQGLHKQGRSCTCHRSRPCRRTCLPNQCRRTCPLNPRRRSRQGHRTCPLNPRRRSRQGHRTCPLNKCHHLPLPSRKTAWCTCQRRPHSKCRQRRCTGIARVEFCSYPCSQCKN